MRADAAVSAARPRHPRGRARRRGAEASGRPSLVARSRISGVRPLTATSASGAARQQGTAHELSHGQVGHEPLCAGEGAEQRRVGARVIGPALIGRDREQRGHRTVGPSQRQRGVGQRLDLLLVPRGRRGIAIAVGAGRVAPCDDTRARSPRRAAAPPHPATNADAGSACGRGVRVRSGVPALRRAVRRLRRRTRSRVRSGRVRRQPAIRAPRRDAFRGRARFPAGPAQPIPLRSSRGAA